MSIGYTLVLHYMGFRGFADAPNYIRRSHTYWAIFGPEDRFHTQSEELWNTKALFDTIRFTAWTKWCLVKVSKRKRPQLSKLCAFSGLLKFLESTVMFGVMLRTKPDIFDVDE